MSITLNDVRLAQERITPYIRRTDIAHVALPLGGELHIKLENLQYTGAFKIRGAFNCMLQLTQEQRSAGVLAASAGNHAQGVARAANALGLNCTIVMPTGAPLSKITATEQYGAKVVLHGNTYDDACAHALQLVEESGATFIHPFNDERVIAGQGTLGLEILEDLPKAGQILVPLGGGGLAAGVAIAAKAIDPTVRVIGVEPKNAASMRASVDAGRIVTLASSNTIADGIAVKTPGDITYSLCRDYLDDIVMVDEDDIARSILYLLEKCKIVSEGAGAAGVAAMLAGKVQLLCDRPTVALLSGGNIDVTMVARIIDKGLIRTGRKTLIRTTISDKPGQLVKLLSIISTTGANIVAIQHDRMAADMNVTESAVELELETRDRRHVFEILSTLEDAGYKLT